MGQFVRGEPIYQYMFIAWIGLIVLSYQWMLYLPSVHVAFYIHPAAYNEVSLRRLTLLRAFMQRPDHCIQIPLKRFYRYNLVPTLDFDENGYVLWLLKA